MHAGWKLESKISLLYVYIVQRTLHMSIYEVLYIDVLCLVSGQTYFFFFLGFLVVGWGMLLFAMEQRAKRDGKWCGMRIMIASKLEIYGVVFVLFYLFIVHAWLICGHLKSDLYKYKPSDPHDFYIDIG